MASSLILNSSVYLYAFVKISPSLIKIVNLTNAINYGEYATKIVKSEIKNRNINFKSSTENKDKQIFSILKTKNLSFKLNNKLTIKYPNLIISRFDKVLIYGKSGKGNRL